MGKNYESAKTKLKEDAVYGIDEGFTVLPSLACAKFDETVEVSGRLGVDPKQADQAVRGTVVLPNGTGKKVRVLVFAKGEKEAEAREAGADYVGAEDFIEKSGWLDFDSIVATPDIMAPSAARQDIGPERAYAQPKARHRDIRH